MTKPMYINIT